MDTIINIPTNVVRNFLSVLQVSQRGEFVLQKLMSTLHQGARGSVVG
jgi:hypothetical protein